MTTGNECLSSKQSELDEGAWCDDNAEWTALSCTTSGAAAAMSGGGATAPADGGVGLSPPPGEAEGIPLLQRGAAVSAESSKSVPPPRPTFRDKLRTFRRPEVVLFLLRALLMGFGMGVVESFLFLYLEQLGASKRLMSLGITFTCVAETPIFHYSGAIIDALGVPGALNLVLAAFVLRLTAYSTMAAWPTLWLLLPVEMLHGVTFGLAWATGAVYAKRTAPPGLHTSLQSAFQSCYFGWGTGSGGLIGGLLYEHVGPARCFATAAAAVAAGMAACWAAEVALSKRSTPCAV